MKKRITIGLILVLLGAGAALWLGRPSAPPMKRVPSLEEAAREALKEGDPARALIPAREAVRILEQERPDSYELAQALNFQGLVLLELREFDRAGKSFQRALDQLDTVHGRDHPDHVVVLRNLARIRKEEKAYLDAARIQERILDLTGRFWGREQARSVRARLEAARIYRLLGDNEKAMRFFRLAYEVGVRNLWPGDPLYEEALTSLVGFAALMGQAGEMPRIYGSWVQYLERSSQGRDPALADSYLALARLRVEAGQIHGAMRAYRRTMEVISARHGANHPEQLAPLLELADLLSLAGRLEQAEELYARAQDIQDRYVGPDEVKAAVIKSGRAEVAAFMGSLARAAKEARQARSIAGRLLDAGAPDELDADSDFFLLPSFSDEQATASAVYVKTLAVTDNISNRTARPSAPSVESGPTPARTAPPGIQ
jgi:tetratricopeptide (TPR) repeat protein